ncbi:MAG: putative O-glycosylation ligase, exosortase A system-associated [Candidatus Rokubacteria bacterium]|nr:putative O-glycosylation ligase, exosortase A system-associated [Candidatus Rokubacteria bacterium]
MYLSLAVAAVVLASLPLTLARPWIGILVWSWLGYMNPHRLTWGFAYSAPFAQMVALATLAGLAFTKERAPLPRTRETYLLFALWTVFGVSTLFSLYPNDAWVQFQKVSKILFMTFVTLLLFQDAKRVKVLLWVIALSIAFYGVKGGIWAIATGGQNQVLGPPDSFIEGNTMLGLALDMVLPILLFLRRQTPRRWLRHVMLAAALLCALSALMTYSRGAFIGLAIVSVALLLRVRAKAALLVLLVLAVLVAPAVIPERWFQKMDTIKTYQEDESAMSRITAWGISYQLALERPLFGGGFRTLTSDVWSRFVPGYTRDTDAHSIYFQVLAEHGFLGLGVFLALILSTLATLRRVKRQTKGHAALAWVRDCAQMLEVSFYAFLVAGAFLSLSYFDLFYHLIAIAVILRVLVERHHAGPPAPAGPASLTGTGPCAGGRPPLRCVEAVR